MSTRGADLRGSRLSELTDEYLHCRLKGHSWDRIPDDGKRLAKYNGRGTTRKLWRCTRCTMLAYEVWVNRTGDMAGPRSYVPPYGYKLSRDRDGNRVKVNAIRRETLARE